MNEKRGFRKTIGIFLAPIIIIVLVFYIIQSILGVRMGSNLEKDWEDDNISMEKERPELIFDENISGGRAILRRKESNNDLNHIFLREKGMKRTEVLVYGKEDNILIETRNLLLNIWKYGYVDIEDINDASRKHWGSKSDFASNPDLYYDVTDMIWNNAIELKEEKSNKKQSLIYLLGFVILLWVYSAFIKK